MSKNFEINLTPQHEEWIKLIPNASKNMDIVFNKLIEYSINDNILLEIISQTLTVADLQKFKNSYSKMQSKRASFIDDLEITKKSMKHIEIVDEPKIIEDLEPIKKETKISQKPKQSKKVSHGFDEDTF